MIRKCVKFPFSLYKCFLKNRHRSKRATVTARNSLYVEYLAVIDKGVYDFFQSFYGSAVKPEQLNDYISIYFTQLISGVSISIKKHLQSNGIKYCLILDESKIPRNIDERPRFNVDSHLN